MPKKKKKVGGGNLGHLVLCLSGRLARKHSEIKQDITKNGGQCTKSVTQNVTHLVSTSEEVHRQTLKVTKAQNFNIPIVTEKFISASLASASNIEEEKFLVTKKKNRKKPKKRKAKEIEQPRKKKSKSSTKDADDEVCASMTARAGRRWPNSLLRHQCWPGPIASGRRLSASETTNPVMKKRENIYSRGLGEAEQELLGAKGDVQDAKEELAAAETKLATAETKFANAQEKWIDAKEESQKARYSWMMDRAKIEVNRAEELVDHYQAKLISLDSDHSTGKESERIRELLKSTFSLKRQTPITFDRELIALEPSLTRATKYIATEIQNPMTEGYRVPPLAITSMARSGKSVLLQSLFNKLLAEEKFNPILVDFNGGGNFFPYEGESDYDAFLRWVATSLLFDKDETVPTFNCKEQDLEEYLSKSPKPIVLLVDELNILNFLNKKKRVSASLARLLRKMFLDKPGRYLCFTSHWFVNLEEVFGNATGTTSPRETKFVRLPRTQNAEEVNKVLQSETNITPVQIAAYLGSVGLLVSKYDLDYEPAVRFNRRTQEHKSLPVESFLDEFCFGEELHTDMRYFDEYTTRLDDGKLAWPLCFAKPFLRKAGEFKLHKLIERTEHAIGLQSVGSGLEWEFAARVAVAVVARCALYRDLEDIESRVIGVPTDCRPKECMIEQLPESIEDPESAQKHLHDIIAGAEQYPVLVMAYPSYSSFSVFDTITCFKASKDDNTKFTGQQMKQSSDVPKNDAPFDGVLLRGDGPENDTKPRTRQNWVYLGREQIESFLPYSLKPLMPSEWLTEAKKKA